MNRYTATGTLADISLGKQVIHLADVDTAEQAFHTIEHYARTIPGDLWQFRRSHGREAIIHVHSGGRVIFLRTVDSCRGLQVDTVYLDGWPAERIHPRSAEWPDLCVTAPELIRA